VAEVEPKICANCRFCMRPSITERVEFQDSAGWLCRRKKLGVQSPVTGLFDHPTCEDERRGDGSTGPSCGPEGQFYEYNDWYERLYPAKGPDPDPKPWLERIKKVMGWK
jgi:hypothetical protein